jgi:hypothetical protein
MATRAIPIDHYARFAPPEEWPGYRLRPQLAELAAGLDERFVRGGSLLADAIGTIRTLLDGLGGMNRALDADAAAQAVAQLRSAATRIAHMPEIMRLRDADLTDVAAVVRQVEGHVADIRRQLQIIGIYGMNIKIAGASGDFRIFVDDMAGRLSAGEAEIEVFAKRLQGVLQSVAPVRKAYAEVLSAQSGMSSEVHEQINACGVRLESHLAGGAALAGQLQTLGGRVQESVGGVLAAIQVADSTRQRIEHVVETFDIIADAARGNAMPPGARDHLARLIGSLIDGANRDHARQSHELTQSMARLAAASGDLASLIDRRTAGDGARSLLDLETGIAAIAQMTARLGETATRAEAMEGCIADAADDLTQRLDSIDQIVRDVKAIAINTRLLCLRQGQTGVAVAVIAVEVAAQATQLKDTAGQVAAAIDRLSGLNQGLRGGAEHGDLGAMLDQAQAVIAQACRHSDAVLADGETSVRQLMAQLDDAVAVVGDEDHLTRTLQPAIAALSRPVPLLDDADESWLQHVLPRIGKLYTMAAEREVHAGFALHDAYGDAHGDAVEPEPVAAVEQDEDGLF